jgi:hypothetical protein
LSSQTEGNGDAFVTKLAAHSGAVVYSIFFGGKFLDEGIGITVRANGEAYVTGNTQSPDFPTKNAFQPMPGGPSAWQSAFVTKISAH